jgi:hypothetical protein
MAEEITYRCPECDTYSGSFTLDGEEMVHSICGRVGSPASFDRDSAEYAAVYDHQEDIDWEDEAYPEQDVTQAFLGTMTTQSWADIAPHLTCREADAAAAMLEAFGWIRNAQVLLEAHGLADDDPSDLHYQGGE